VLTTGQLACAFTFECESTPAPLACVFTLLCLLSPAVLVCEVVAAVLAWTAGALACAVHAVCFPCAPLLWKLPFVTGTLTAVFTVTLVAAVLA
jgi:hypothetical protein